MSKNTERGLAGDWNDRGEVLVFPIKLFFEDGEFLEGLVVEEVMALVQKYYNGSLDRGWSREKLIEETRIKKVVDGATEVIARMRVVQKSSISHEEGRAVGVERDGLVRMAVFREPEKRGREVELKSFVVYQNCLDNLDKLVTVYRKIKSEISCKVIIYLDRENIKEIVGAAYALRIETEGAVFGTGVSYPAVCDILFFDEGGKLIAVAKNDERRYFV